MIIDHQFTPYQQALLNTGRVLLVSKESEEIPEAERRAVLRGFAIGGGVAVTIDRQDNTLLIVTDGPVGRSVWQHEFIHCAQFFAGSGSMENALSEAANIGRRIVGRIQAVISVAPEAEQGGHRDYFRIRPLGRLPRTMRRHSSPPISSCSKPWLNTTALPKRSLLSRIWDSEKKEVSMQP